MPPLETRSLNSSGAHELLAPAFRPGLANFLIGLLAALSFAAALAGYGVVWTGVQTTRLSQKRHREQVVRALSKTVDVRLRTAEQLIEAGAHRPGLILFLAANESKRVEEVLRVICQETPYYRAAFVFSPQMELVASYPKSGVAQPRLSEAPWERRILRDGRLLTVEAIRRDGILLGFLVGDIDLKRVAQDVAEEPGPEGFVAYVSAKGETIAGYESRRLRLQPPVEGDETIRHIALDSQYLATWGRAPPGAWVVLVTPRSVAAGLEVILFRVGVLLLAIWIVFAAAAGVMLRAWVIQPVTQIAEIARRVTEGDTTARAGRPRVRELGVLAIHFNAMTDRLVALIDQVREDNMQLEDRIKKRTSELAEALDRAEIAAKAKDQFVANVSHELRTPLQGIVAAVELLKDEAMTSAAHRKLVVVNQSAQSLQKIIGQVLDFARLESGALQVADEVFTIDSLCAALELRFRQRAEDTGIALDFDVPEESQFLRSDGTKILQIVSNLVDNALKFTSEGAVKVRFTVAHQRLTVDVVDTGPGIPNSESKRIFGRFQRASNDLSVEGVGLGLAISRRLARNLGGDLEHRAQPTGAWFRFTVPVCLEASRPVLDTQTRASDRPAAVRPRVLVADDHPINGWLIGELLDGLGFEVIVVEDVEHAIDVASRTFLALALVDWHMPPRCGEQMAVEVRKMSSLLLRSCPLVAVTGVATPQTRRAATAAGFDIFMVKPVNRAALEAILSDSPVADSVGWRRAFDGAQLDDLRTMTRRGEELVFEGAEALLASLQSDLVDHGWLQEAPEAVAEAAHRSVGITAGLGAVEAEMVFRALERDAKARAKTLNSRQVAARIAAQRLISHLRAMLALTGKDGDHSRS